MKHLLKIFSAFALLLVAVNCNNSDDFTFIDPAESFKIVSPNENAALLLDGANTQNVALTLVWQDNISGADNYTVEMAADEEFTAPIVLGSSTSLSFSMTVGELNAVLLDNNIQAFEESDVFFRILGGDDISEVLKMKLSSYPENNPVITSPDSSFEIVLTDISEDELATTIEWNDPDFSENPTATINYYVEGAIAGTDFATVETLGTTEDTMLEMTYGELNDVALNLGIEPETAGSIDIRIRSVIETAAGDLERISNVITITVTPYETALLPVIYAVGAGIPTAGWVWDSPAEFPLQGSVYSGNVMLSPENDGNFRFFGQQDWGPVSFNYPWYESRGFTIDENLVNANDGDSNFQFIGTEGEYFLEIDMENKTITLGPPVVGPNCEYDQLWLVGAGITNAGWNWDSPVELPCTGNGVYSGNVDFSNDSFRFFAQQDWNPISFNYPYYEGAGYTIDSNFANANDGDSNFSFTGTPGEYYLSVDTINKTITLGDPQIECEYETLWIVGAGVNGWNWDSPVEFPCTGAGVYSAEVTFTNEAFRFFAQQDWGPVSFNYPHYESEGYTIDSNFENANDGDSNFSFVGTPGTYILTMDTVNKTITLQ
ncbi:SusE domain-containing protein [Mangrovimonas sp. YM274]|uniref:SusE domain-containing protein n=1 Tax=Mangrovimonas sp. YM274 TaxID=3070660 RepID=UPI0027DBD523|nr:SusE domain-containing protein [Mangrovimonas sp. YM274]WMI68553.1 SusE domain-containing protein [Mangrovimonas sp. YM274]